MKCHVHEIHGCRGGKKTPALTHASSGSSYNGLARLPPLRCGANLKHWTQEKIDHPCILPLLSSSAGCPGPLGFSKRTYNRSVCHALFGESSSNGCVLLWLDKWCRLQNRMKQGKWKATAPGHLRDKSPVPFTDRRICDHELTGIRWSILRCHRLLQNVGFPGGSSGKEPTCQCR